LKPGGAFGLTCFGAKSPETSGADVTDWQVYRDRKMHGGIGYSRQRLMTIFSSVLDVVELRQMKKYEPHDDLFGEPFLWVGLFRKR
jgi:hypothetical protein